MQGRMEVVLATCVVFACPKLEISPPVAGGELHVVLARRMILDECHDRAAMSCKCSIAGMREELLYGGLSVLTREVLIYVGLIERPEIDGLTTLEVGDADKIALGDHKALACSRGDVNSLFDSQGNGHAAPYFWLSARSDLSDARAECGALTEPAESDPAIGAPRPYAREVIAIHGIARAETVPLE
jgi:hypothetical protein